MMPHKDLQKRKEYHRSYYRSGLRVCFRCREPLSPDSTHVRCESCHQLILQDQRLRRSTPEGRLKHRQSSRKTKLKMKYGISEKTFDQKLLNQDNKCGICRTEFISTPHVDHNHKTGRVRALLCSMCNKGLGQFKDDQALLMAAAAYLEVWK